MLFTSIIFISFFLPITLITYFLTPTRFKNLTILIASIIFYIWGEKNFIFLLIGTIIINFISGLIIGRGYKKIGLAISLFFSLGSLFYFKYANFAYSNIIELLDALHITNRTILTLPHIVLPLGISFFTFQVLSYTIDIYRGHIKASNNFINFSTYILLFPHLIAGPIVRYADIETQLIKKDISLKRITEGLERFVIGLIKKMYLANNCAIIVDTIFEVPPEYSSSAVLWLGAIAYTLQIYFDFSAYSDMAIGLAKVFGINFHENFNYPYTSNSIKEFWRRWHISLSSWFRDYLYIPLGGNRISEKRTYLNLFIVFLATGLWHGASWNFIFWGLWHGFFLIIERMGFGRFINKLFKPIQYIYTIIIIIVGWVFFRVEDSSVAVEIIKKMFYWSSDSLNTVFYINDFFTIKNSIVLFSSIIFCFPIFSLIKEKLVLINYTFKNLNLFFYYSFILLLFIGCIMMSSIGTYNPFIYFRF